MICTVLDSDLGHIASYFPSLVPQVFRQFYIYFLLQSAQTHFFSLEVRSDIVNFYGQQSPIAKIKSKMRPRLIEHFMFEAAAHLGVYR